MKYYAVTEDPRELYHYGVKGMKWGQHLFGDKPKSPAYKRATQKLKANSRAKEERKYENAVKKSQDRISRVENLYKADQKRNRKPTAREKNALVERLHKMDQDKAIYKAINKEQKRVAKQQKLAEKAYRAEEKREMKYAKNEAKMDKYVQQARQGKLKYGKLSPDQIQRVQDRLLLEANTRRLGAAEKTWGQQKKEARRKGKLQGIERGTAAVMEEVARAGAQWGIAGVKNRMLLNNKAKQEGKRERIRNAEKNKKSHRDVVNEFKQEAFEERVKSGEGIIARNNPFTKTAKQQAKRLNSIERQKKLNSAYQDYLDSNGLTDKEARRQYREGLSGDDANKYGVVRLGNNKSTKERQQRMLLAANKKAKEEADRDAKLRDEIYKRYLMPGKNDNPDDMLRRFEDSDARARFYKDTKPKSSNGQSNNKKQNNYFKDFINDNLVNPMQVRSGLVQNYVDPDFYRGRKTTSSEKKSINRHNKKLAKTQRHAVRRLNGY